MSTFKKCSGILEQVRSDLKALESDDNDIELRRNRLMDIKQAMEFVDKNIPTLERKARAVESDYGPKMKQKVFDLCLQHQQVSDSLENIQDQLNLLIQKLMKEKEQFQLQQEQRKAREKLQEQREREEKRRLEIEQERREKQEEEERIAQVAVRAQRIREQKAKELKAFEEKKKAEDDLHMRRLEAERKRKVEADRKAREDRELKLLTMKRAMQKKADVQQVMNKEHYDAMVLSAEYSLVVVDWSATWCGPCRLIKPIYQDLSKEFNDVIFSTVDADTCQDLIHEHHVRSFPTFFFLINGDKVGEFSGADATRLRNEVIKFRLVAEEALLIQEAIDRSMND